MTQKTAKSLAVIYVRQSNRRKGENDISLDVQEKDCRVLPAVAACATIEVLSDPNVSGGKKNRKGLMALVERIKSGDVSVVTFYDASRISRDNLISAEFYALMEQHPEIDCPFGDGGHLDRSPDGELSWTITSATATHYRKLAAKKIKGIYAAKNGRGEATGMPPYGYRWAPKVLGMVRTFEVYEPEAAVVRRIFAEYAESSTSAKALAAKLNAEKVERPGNRSVHGWLPDTVVDTLRRVAYVGKTYKTAGGQGELIDAQWPAIVERSMFDTVRDLMDRRKVQARRPTPDSYIFGRLLVCSRCQGIMRATRTYGHAYYHCRRDVSDRCTAPAVREDVLLSWAGALFLRIAERIGSGLTITTKATKRKAAGPSPSGIEAALQRLELAWVRGTASEAMYDAERPRLLAKLADAKAAAVEPEADEKTGNLYWQMALANWTHGADGETEQADPIMQRRTLNKLFEVLYVEDGAVVSYKPRTDQRATIERVIEQAQKPPFTYDEPLTGRGANLTKAARKSRRTARLPLHVDGVRGKGGIRTLEGALHPLPA